MQNISSLCNAKDFDKKYALAFHNLELNYDKQNYIHFKYVQFSRDVVKLTYVLIYLLKKCVLEGGFKDSCVLKNLQNLKKNIHDGVYC